MFQFKQMTILKRIVLLLLTLGFICSVVGILQIEIKKSVPQYESLEELIVQIQNNEKVPKPENTTIIELSNNSEHSPNDKYINNDERSTTDEGEMELVTKQIEIDESDHTEYNNAQAAATMEQLNESKININTATAEQLQQLKGIGPAKAEAIVAERNSRGPFKTIEDIKRVKGIGDKTFETIKESLVN